MRITDLLDHSATLYRGDEAVFDGRTRCSFGELATRAAATARGLARLGVRAGERVAIVSTNRAEYVEAYFALARLGVVAVPINWRLRATELEYQLQDSESVAVLAEERFVEPLELCRPTCPRVRNWIMFDGEHEGWLRFAECSASTGEPLAPAAITESDVAIQMYTSGTTGAPKGAMLTHRNVCALVSSWLHELRLGSAPDRFLQVTPLFHVGGMLQVMSAVAAGASLRLLPEFLPGPALDALEREAVTHALFVPAMVQWLLAEKDVASRRFPSLRLIVYGAAPMPVQTLTRALDVFRCDFLQGYGLTETAGVVTTLRPADHRFAAGSEPPARLASAGRAVLGCEVRVVDTAGRDVAPGAIGEIVVRGEQVGPGYWRRPAETAEAFRDGWFHTGDLATLDEHGYVTIVDRLKDMILVAGENVYPGEIEAILREHPGLADVAVIGIPHEHWGEEVLALAVLRPGSEVGDRELIQHCRAKLARFKCPTRVERRTSLPRNAAGKLQKRELREPYWAGRTRRV
ncbi:MAG: long-chain-fatty-acid--CoA ligase [Planctomycetes bacterium]|nr:long-chain-fatty-acid--CoA ligase [Planctomycetota bacterium]